MSWRVDDENLLRRLEDESLIEQLFSWFLGPRGAARDVGARPAVLPPRAAGLVAELRRRPTGGEAVVRALETGRVEGVALLVEELELGTCSPELLHHLALFHGNVAEALEQSAPEIAASGWVRALAAWLALAEERQYLARLESAVGAGTSLAAPPERAKSLLPPERVPVELVVELGRRADATARDLGASGRAALLALARIDEAAKRGGASADLVRRVRAEADRARNAAIEAALGVIGDGLDEASVRGELVTQGRTLLLRAIAVWSWTSHDEAVEHFVVERLDKIGWELYRARSWDTLRYLLDPFQPMLDHLADRLERDPSRIAYAAGCAQMFVFRAETTGNAEQKRVFAERAVKVCPTHRNGRLILASALCDEATTAMRAMALFARASEIGRVEGLLARAESLYPQLNELPTAKAALAQVKKGKITI